MRSNVRFARQERSLDILSHSGRNVRQLRTLLPSSNFFAAFLWLCVPETLSELMT